MSDLVGTQIVGFLTHRLNFNRFFSRQSTKLNNPLINPAVSNVNERDISNKSEVNMSFLHAIKHD